MVDVCCCLDGMRGIVYIAESFREMIVADRSNPHASNLRKHRYREDGCTFFVTKALQPRRPLLACDEIATVICETFLHYQQQGDLHVAAFVVMPDHWHALFGLPFGSILSRKMTMLMSWISRQTKDLLHDAETTWQDGFYDTRIRSGKQFSYVCSSGVRVWGSAVGVVCL